MSGKILITTVLHNSIQCSDTTPVTGAKAIPKIECKYNTLSLCLLLWLLAPSLWLLIYCGLCLSLTDFCSPSLNVSFFLPRELTPHLCYLFPAPRYNVVKFFSPCHVILSHLSKTGVYIMLYIFCNTISSQEAMVCTQCYCVLLNAVGGPNTKVRAGMLKSLEDWRENWTIQAKIYPQGGTCRSFHTYRFCWVADSRCWLLLTLITIKRRQGSTAGQIEFYIWTVHIHYHIILI